LQEKLRKEKEAEEMFNYEEYFKSSDMFTGVPPVYKRILNTLLNFEENVLDRHDFNSNTIYNVDNMLKAEHMLKPNQSDLNNL